MIEEKLERIAVALEWIVTFLRKPPGTGVVVNSVSAVEGKVADTDPKAAAKAKKAADAAAAAKAAADKAAAEAKDDDGLGDDEAAEVSFETMREKLVAVKEHPKLGKTVSKEAMAKFGAASVTDIKPEDFAAVVAFCEEKLAKAK